MNDFSDLEAELKRLRPRAPSAALATRIEQDLSKPFTKTATAGILPRRAKTRAKWFGLGLGLAAAAALLVLARVNMDRPAQSEAKVAASKPIAPRLEKAPTNVARAFVPDGVTRVLYDRSNEGLVFPANSDQPVRRVRSRSRETLKWKNPGTGASLRVSYPTEEVELIPAGGQ